MDRISNLPDDLIRRIVRFLAVKDALSVLLISRRYRNLYTIIPHLEFDDTVKFQGTFTDLVSGALARLRTTTCIRRFSLKSKRGLDPNRINHWLRDVSNRSIMDLELRIKGNNGYALPLEIFTCKTLIKLKLWKDIVITVLPENALLPALETLILDSVRFYNPADCAFQAFLLACPALKELIIDGMYWETWKWSGNVSSQSLQRLTIGRELSRGFDGPDPQYITFDTPSLVYLDYGDFVPDGYTIVNFESLVEAKLNLLVMVNRQWDWNFADDGDILSSNATNLIQGIRNVEILELPSPHAFETLYFFRDAIPVFEKLHHLTMTHDDTGFCWRFLPFLLNKTPNLKTLVIEDGLHYVEVPGDVEEPDYAEEPDDVEGPDYAEEPDDVEEHEYAEELDYVEEPDDVEEPDYVGGPDDVEEHDYVCGCLSGYSCLLSCPLEVLEIDLWYNGSIGELEQIKHFLGKLSRLKLLIVHSRERISDKEKLRIVMDLLMLPRASSECKIQISFT